MDSGHRDVVCSRVCRRAFCSIVSLLSFVENSIEIEIELTLYFSNFARTLETNDIFFVTLKQKNILRNQGYEDIENKNCQRKSYVRYCD